MTDGVSWWWVVVAFAVAWYWSRQREQNLVTMHAAAAYQAQHPINDPSVAPPAVNFADVMKAMRGDGSPATTVDPFTAAMMAGKTPRPRLFL